jgi:zinc protease
MQFKGTPRYPAAVLDRSVSRDGGMWNAFTHLDWTTFFETMPADKIELALDLEADRMVNSVYEVEEVNSERTVIISEREGSENEPLFKLDEAVQSAAFKFHPYRNEVLGSKTDLHAIQRDDLYTHYKTYYNPANAVIAVAGDFNSSEMLDQIQKKYAHLPGHVVEAPKIEPEKTSFAEQRVEVSGPAETTYLEVSYHAPAASDHDFFAFSILDSLITGPTSLNMFGGGGISNKTSRLYRRLVEKELAISVNGSLQATYDPFLYNIIITVHPRHTPEEVLAQVDEEIKTILQSPVAQSEIDRAAKQARALFTYGSENITNQGFWLGYSEMFDKYAWFLNYVKELEAVNSEEVLRIVREYLQPIHRVVGIYRPNGGQQ